MVAEHITLCKGKVLAVIGKYFVQLALHLLQRVFSTVPKHFTFRVAVH